MAARTVGFDEWKDYVLGAGAGGGAGTAPWPRRPEWAEAECGIPAREIRALAREWAAKRTMVAPGSNHGMGGACRSATGNEWTRAIVALAAMQGMGKPGSNIWATTTGTPVDTTFVMDGYAEGGISGDVDNSAAGFRWVYRMFPQGGATRTAHHSTEGQTVDRLRIPEAMMGEKLEWRGKGFCGSSIESQFKLYKYPASGYSPVAMYYRYGGSYLGTMTESNRFARAYREGTVEFVVNQNVWFEGETKFADIVLPACTNLERWDIAEWANCSGYIPDSYGMCNHRVIVLQKKCIEPLGESKSDYQIFAELSKRLGLWEIFTAGGKTEYDWVKQSFYASDLPDRRHLGGVREEGLLRGAAPPGRPQVDARLPLVRRGPPARHSRLGPPSGRPGGSQGPADVHRQDRVRLLQPHPLREDRRGRPGAPAPRPAVHRELGGPPHDRAHGEATRCR